tara:strand:+ start:6095 stop:6379 length:285 start_codon:yes stop_codon:yes gene_type:complete
MTENNICQPGKIPESGQWNSDGTNPFLIPTKNMPKPIKHKHGGRCEWYYFDTYSKARIAAFVAENNASILGCDSWFQVPGQIQEEEGLFMVTFP